MPTVDTGWVAPYQPVIVQNYVCAGDPDRAYVYLGLAGTQPAVVLHGTESGHLLALGRAPQRERLVTPALIDRLVDKRWEDLLLAGADMSKPILLLCCHGQQVAARWDLAAFGMVHAFPACPLPLRIRGFDGGLVVIPGDPDNWD